MKSEMDHVRRLGWLLTVSRNADELVELIKTSRTVLSSFAKAKTAKLGKNRIPISICHIEAQD